MVIGRVSEDSASVLGAMLGLLVVACLYAGYEDWKSGQRRGALLWALLSLLFFAGATVLIATLA